MTSLCWFKYISATHAVVARQEKRIWRINKVFWVLKRWVTANQAMLDLIPVIFSATDNQTGVRICGEQLAFHIYLRFESNQSVKLFLSLLQQKKGRKSSVLKSRKHPYNVKHPYWLYVFLMLLWRICLAHIKDTVLRDTPKNTPLSCFS